MKGETTKVGRRGTVIIPSPLRRKYGMEEGSLVLVEEKDEGVFLRPVVALPVEIYTSQRKAEFLLNCAVTREDYLWALKEVRNMGIDPETIPHEKPKGL
jgi:AbrB family looped-hinge helix DNA binding protein